MSVAEWKWQHTFCYFSRRVQFHMDQIFDLVINTMDMTWPRLEHKHGTKKVLNSNCIKRRCVISEDRAIQARQLQNALNYMLRKP